MIDEIQLKNSLAEAEIYLTRAVEDGKHEFSPKFTRFIKKLIYKEKHPIAYYFKNSVASIILALLLGGTIILGVSKTARAAVLAWLSDFYEGTFLYHGNSNTEIDISAYSIRKYISNDYTYSETVSYKNKNEVCESFMDSEGYFLYFYVVTASEGKATQLLPDAEDKVQQITIGNYRIDHYYDSSDTSNAYVWYDEYGVLFYIGGHINAHDIAQLTNDFLNNK